MPCTRHPARALRFPMRNAPLVLAALVLSSAVATLSAQETPDVSRLAWLAGCWTQPRANAVIEEHWMAPLGGSMLGMSRTVVDGRTREYEFVRIMAVDGRLAYVAKPSAQAEATFPVKTLEDGLVVFENPTHDFPQRVIYRRNADGTITARIEGTIKGEARGRDFPYRRCVGRGTGE
jgi:Domain of unknown function (DUF6265)